MKFPQKEMQVTVAPVVLLQLAALHFAHRHASSNHRRESTRSTSLPPGWEPLEAEEDVMALVLLQCRP